MKNQYEILREDILREQGRIDEILLKLDRVRTNFVQNPDEDIYVAAAAKYLENFYEGIESILKNIFKVYYEDRKRFKGDTWHKDLLTDSYASIPEGKIAILSEATVERLRNYLAFRHKGRHKYVFELEWDKMKPLIENVAQLWSDIKKELQKFFSQVVK